MHIKSPENHVSQKCHNSRIICPILKNFSAELYREPETVFVPQMFVPEKSSLPIKATNYQLEQRQYKNYSIKSKIIPILKLARFFPHCLDGETERQFQSWNHF